MDKLQYLMKKFDKASIDARPYDGMGGILAQIVIGMEYMKYAYEIGYSEASVKKEQQFAIIMKKVAHLERDRIIKIIDGEIWTHHEFSSPIDAEDQQQLNDMMTQAHNGGLEDVKKLI